MDHIIGDIKNIQNKTSFKNKNKKGSFVSGKFPLYKSTLILELFFTHLTPFLLQTLQLYGNMTRG